MTPVHVPAGDQAVPVDGLTVHRSKLATAVRGADVIAPPPAGLR
jgi:hypothetical protein